MASALAMSSVITSPHEPGRQCTAACHSSGASQADGWGQRCARSMWSRYEVMTPALSRAMTVALIAETEGALHGSSVVESTSSLPAHVIAVEGSREETSNDGIRED